VEGPLSGQLRFLPTSLALLWAGASLGMTRAVSLTASAVSPLFVQILRDVPCVALGDSQLGHCRLRVRRRRIHDPAHDVLGLVRQNAGDVHALRNATERWTDEAAWRHDSRNRVTGAAAVALDRELPAFRVAAHDDRRLRHVLSA